MGSICCYQVEEQHSGKGQDKKREPTSAMIDNEEILSFDRKLTAAQREASQARILSFSAYKGFKQIDNCASKYKMTKQLGQGAFGTVWAAVHKQASAPCAVKIVSKHKLKEMEVYQELMMNELTVLEETVHPNITKVFELFEDSKNFYIICELISGGNMLEKMIEMESISEAQTSKIIK